MKVKPNVRRYQNDVIDRGLFSISHIRQGELITEVDSASTQTLSYMINHSCSPNALVRKGRVIAGMCIEEGEEITIDYRKTHPSDSFDCRCCGERIEW